MSDNQGFGPPRKVTRLVPANHHRFLIPTSLVADVFGNKGQTIKEILNETKAVDGRAEIHISNKSTDGFPLMPNTEDRVLKIVSSPEGLATALNRLIPLLQFKSEKQSSLELRMMVPKHSCPALIGRGGEHVNKLKTELNTFTYVYDIPLPESMEVCVKVHNDYSDGLISSVLQLTEAIAENKGSRPIALYDPIWFEQGLYGNTGSFIDTARYNDCKRFNRDMSWEKEVQKRHKFGYTGGPMRPGQKRPAPGEPPQVFGIKRAMIKDMHRFLIPEDLVKNVIGPGGNNIRTVIEQTQNADPDANIQIRKQTADGLPIQEGAEDRIMTIQSTYQGLRGALFLLIPYLQYDNWGRKEKLEIRLLVPSHCAAAIIGKGGSTMRQIKEDTKSFLQIYTIQMPESEETCVRIQNWSIRDLVETVVRCCQAVEKNKNHKLVKLYDPFWFEQCAYGDTGSYMDTFYYQACIKAGEMKMTPFQGKPQ